MVSWFLHVENFISTKIIINLKNISKQNVFKLARPAAIIISFLFILAGSAHAEAKELSLQDVIDFAKERIRETKNIVLFDRAGEGAIEEKVEHEKKDKEKKDYPDQDVDIREVEKHAEFASEKAGINKDYLMGMLVVESALGQNTGQCTYEEVQADAKRSYENGMLSNQAWQTFLERRRKIKKLAHELGYDADKLKVSCNPKNYAGTGGAMGIGQFMPDTWIEYKERVAEVVGKDNPDPWDVRDGVVAMALKVSDVPGVKDHNVWAERAASKMYLSGTTSWQYDWYANEAQYWKNNYKKLLS